MLLGRGGRAGGTSQVGGGPGKGDPCGRVFQKEEGNNEDF